MRRRRTIRGVEGSLLLFAAVCALLSCTARSPQPATPVEQYLRLAAALGERDTDSLDYFYGSPEILAEVRGTRPTLQSIKAAAAELSARLERQCARPGRDAERNDFLIAQLRAIAARVDVLAGVRSSFDQESRSMFGLVVPASYDPKPLSAALSELDGLLPGHGALAPRYAAFERRYIIAPARLRPVMERAIAGCRAATVAHLGLPPGESVSLELVRNRPWSGYSWYKGDFRSVLQVNADLPLTVDRALQLACHEGYPGHHVFNSLREAELVRGEGDRELSVQTTFSPQSLVSEAAATVAADVAFPHEARLRFEREVLFPAAGIDARSVDLYLRVEELVDRLHPAEAAIAREYVDGLEFERAGEALQRLALMQHPEGTLQYINEYRSYVTTYTAGRDRMAGLLNEAGDGEAARWAAYQRIVLHGTSPLLFARTTENGSGTMLRTCGG